MIANRKTLLILIAINTLVFLLYLKVIPPEKLDFQAFYYAAKEAQRAPSLIYDLDQQRLTHREHFGDRSQFLPFFHPPHELLFFLPFSTLPYALSFNAWRLFSLFCLFGSGLLLSRALCLDRLTAVIFAFAMAQVGEILVLGQDSLLLFLLVCGCFCLLKQERDVAAAFVLTVALFKPQIPAILALAVLAAGRKKFFAWFAGAGGVLAAASIWFVGKRGIWQMLEGEKLAEHSLAKMPTVRGVVAFAIGDHLWLPITLLVAAMIGIWTVWRRSHSLDFAVGSAICLGGAFSPYLISYDLILLAIPLGLIVQKPQKHDWLVGVVLTNAMVFPILNMGRLSSLLLVPTLVLGLMTFRLAVSEPVPALEPDLQLF